MNVSDVNGGSVILGFIFLLEDERPSSPEEWDALSDLLNEQARELARLTNLTCVHIPKLPPAPIAPLSYFTGL
jgi:hypothetical protein